MCFDSDLSIFVWFFYLKNIHNYDYNPFFGFCSGLPPSLCEELMIHGCKSSKLYSQTTVIPEVVTMALSHLQGHPGNPLILHGPPGCGLKTVAAHLARMYADLCPLAMIGLRFMGLSPDSSCLSASLFSVLEQAAMFEGNGFSNLQVIQT